MMATQRRVTLRPLASRYLNHRRARGTFAVSLASWCLPDYKSCPLAHDCRNDKYLSWLTMKGTFDRNFAHFVTQHSISDTDRRWRKSIRKNKISVERGTASYLHQTFALYIVFWNKDFHLLGKVKFRTFFYLRRACLRRRHRVYLAYKHGCVCILSGNNILYLYFTQHHISMRYTYCKHDSGMRNNSSGG